ncbi:MAG TPA: OadG family protein [Candidatus Aphodoplasma excrementigallinarum]|uniref:OadG family protein n=1 Tax=Candidatus Aphodoplasma excrementigallinarum TaxID=2840673 RepID=A0A9D1NHV1_9FIRM|nr:OadG family protein [Candidatus Aphodoplasma excrementigallinarum]
MENFTTGLLVALQGMLIVFAALIILMVVLNIMKLFSKEESKVSAKSSGNAPAPVPAQSYEDNDETIVVISAAVAAMSGNDPTKRLRVMSIRRQGSATPLWTASK